jgi:hypothetical protein
MKTVIAVLILIALLEISIIPLDLVLLILILRSYLNTSTDNLLLAFGFGLLISYLTNLPLGFYSIIYLILIELTLLFRKTPLASHFFVIVPLIFALLSLQSLAVLVFFHQTINWWQLGIESVLALLLYFILKIWEERFVVRNEVKLKI